MKYFQILFFALRIAALGATGAVISCGDNLSDPDSSDGDSDGDADADADADGDADTDADTECTQDKDCTLQNDCCECAGVVSGEPIMSCAMACAQNTCENLTSGVIEAVCRSGQCVLNVPCKPSDDMCERLTYCQDGTTPIIDETGNCYTGGCIPPSECSDWQDL